MGNQQSIRKVMEDSIENDPDLLSGTMNPPEVKTKASDTPPSLSESNIMSHDHISASPVLGNKETDTTSGKSRSASFSHSGEYRNRTNFSLPGIKKQEPDPPPLLPPPKTVKKTEEKTNNENAIAKSNTCDVKSTLKNKAQVPFKETIDLFIEGYLLDKNIVLSDELGKVKAVYSNDPIKNTPPPIVKNETIKCAIGENFLSLGERNDHHTSQNKDVGDGQPRSSPMETVRLKGEPPATEQVQPKEKSTEAPFQNLLDINSLIEKVIDKSLNEKDLSLEKEKGNSKRINNSVPSSFSSVSRPRNDIKLETEKKPVPIKTEETHSLREHIDRIVQESIRECGNDDNNSKSENLVSLVDRSAGRRSSSFSASHGPHKPRTNSPSFHRGQTQHVLMRTMLDNSYSARQSDRQDHVLREDMRNSSLHGHKFPEAKSTPSASSLRENIPPLAEAVREHYHFPPSHTIPTEVHREKSATWPTQQTPFSAAKKYREHHGMDVTSTPHLIHAEQYYNERQQIANRTMNARAQYQDQMRANEIAASRQVPRVQCSSGDLRIVPSPQLFNSEYQHVLRGQMRPEIAGESVHPESCDCNRCVNEMTHKIGLVDGYARYASNTPSSQMGIHVSQTHPTKGSYSDFMAQSQNNLRAAAARSQFPIEHQQPNQQINQQPHLGVIPPPSTAFSTYAPVTTREEREPLRDERLAHRVGSNSQSQPYARQSSSPRPERKPEVAPNVAQSVAPTASQPGSAPLDLSVKTSRDMTDLSPRGHTGLRGPPYSLQGNERRQPIQQPEPILGGDLTNGRPAEQYSYWKGAPHSKPSTPTDYRVAVSPRQMATPTRSYTPYAANFTEQSSIKQHGNNVHRPHLSPTDQTQRRSLGSMESNRKSESPTNEGDRKDTNGSRRGSVSKHEPIQNILGANMQNDILYLICRLCGQTYGSPYGFRKHFRNQHGFEPQSDHTIVKTISATKHAMNSSAMEPNPHYRAMTSVHYANDQTLALPCPVTDANGKPSFNKVLESEEQHYSKHTKDSKMEMVPESELLDKAKFLECPECGQTFQLNDFGAYKRHCRQHNCSTKSSSSLSCSECNVNVRDLLELKEHMMVHSSSPTRICRLCSGEFRNDDQLREHLLDVHGNSTAGETISGLTTITNDRSSPRNNTPDAGCRDVTRRPADQLGAVSASPDSSTPHESSVTMETTDKTQTATPNLPESPASDSGHIIKDEDVDSKTHKNKPDDGKQVSEPSAQSFSYKHKKFGKHRITASSDNSSDAEPPRKMSRSESLDSDSSQYNSIDSTQKSEVSTASSDVNTCDVTSSLPVDKKQDIDSLEKVDKKVLPKLDEVFEKLKSERSDQIQKGSVIQKTEARHNMPFVCDRTKVVQRQPGVLLAGKK